MKRWQPHTRYDTLLRVPVAEPESTHTLCDHMQQIADAHQFSGDCMCSVHLKGCQRNKLGVSIQDDLFETNLLLQMNVRELQAQLAAQMNRLPAAVAPTPSTGVASRRLTQCKNERRGHQRLELLPLLSVSLVCCFYLYQRRAHS